MEWWPLEVTRAAVSNIKLQKKKSLLVTVLKKLPLVSFLFFFLAAAIKKNIRRPPRKKGAGKGHKHNECQDLIDTVAARTACSLCGDVILHMLITLI